MRRFIVPAFVSVLLFTSGASAQYYQDSSVVVVRNWYRQFLHREAEPSGLTGWSDMLRQGAQPAQVLADILGGDEYSQIAGGTSEGFVRTLFRDLTGREPATSDMNYWLARLSAGTNRDVAYEMLLQFPQNWSAPGAPIGVRVYGRGLYWPSRIGRWR